MRLGRATGPTLAADEGGACRAHRSHRRGASGGAGSLSDATRIPSIMLKESPALNGTGLSRNNGVDVQWPLSGITGHSKDLTIPMSTAAPAFSAARTSASSSKTPLLPP
jgi:hypothetical protein